MRSHKLSFEIKNTAAVTTKKQRSCRLGSWLWLKIKFEELLTQYNEIYLWVNRGVHHAFLQIKDNLPVCRFFSLLYFCWKVSNEKKLSLCNWNFKWMKRVNMEAVPAHVSEYPVKHHCSCPPARRLEWRYMNRNTFLMEKSPSVGSDKWVQPSYLLLGRVSDVAYLQEWWNICAGGVRPNTLIYTGN